MTNTTFKDTDKESMQDKSKIRSATNITSNQIGKSAVAPTTGRSETGTASGLPNLFYVTSQVCNLYGDKSLKIIWFVIRRPRRLFGDGGSLDIGYERVITDFDESHDHADYRILAAEENFTVHEAVAFSGWIAGCRSDVYFETRIEPATLPISENDFGLAGLVYNTGEDRILEFTTADYDLPFEVCGYPSAPFCDYGPLVRTFRVLNGHAVPIVLEQLIF